MRQVGCDLGMVEDRPVRGGKAVLESRDNEDVATGCLEYLIRPETLMQRGEHTDHQPIVDLVQMQPLAEDSIFAQIVADTPVELRREEPRYSAHPWVGRFGQDQIEARV